MDPKEVEARYTGYDTPGPLLQAKYCEFTVTSILTSVISHFLWAQRDFSPAQYMAAFGGYLVRQRVAA
jgi:hypothetical protein